MKLPGFSVQAVIAVIVVGGAFVLFGIYVYQGRTPDAVVTGFVSAAAGSVLGFYFGHVSGSTAALVGSVNALTANRLAAPTVIYGGTAQPPPPGTNP